MEIELIPISPNTELYQSSVLRVGSLRILLDCGWTDRMDVSAYIENSSLISQIDLVLLSHYDLAHCGALPWLLSTRRLKPAVRILATECVRRMAELTVGSVYEDIDKVKNATVSDDSYTLNLEDIVISFSKRVEPVQFNQKIDFASISLSAHPCGRLIGGAYWVITAGTDRIVYCVDYSMVSGKHVGGLSVEAATRVTVLVTACTTGDANARDSEDRLINLIKSTLRSDGSILLPVDPNGRVLELLLMLESAWAADAALGVYPVIFLSSLGDVVLDQVKTRMEWMNKSLVDEFENSVNFAAHPFVFNHISIESDMNQFVEKFPGRKPKVLLAPHASLEFGDAREMFVRMAGDPSNLVVFTHVSGLEKDSWASRIIRDIDGGVTQTYKEPQFLKSPYPDEQLREIYRESLQREAQEDELRRRRARERQMSQQLAAAPSSAAAVPVDLIRASGGTNYELDLEGTDGSFFRPQLFVAQTVASGPVLEKFGKSNIGDYGSTISSMEINTWRAHAEMSDLSASREAAAEAAAASGRIKGERVKNQPKEEMMKGDLYDEDNRIKGELGAANENTGFDWRRDMQMRFGEPQRVEVRERNIKVACKIKVIPGLEGRASAVHNREFVSAVQPKNLILLPNENVRESQVMAMLPGKCFTNEVALHLTGTSKKWVHVDVLTNLPFVELGNGTRIARLDGGKTNMVGPLHASSVPDLIQAPTGDHVEYSVVPGNAKRKRDTTVGLLIAEKPFTLAHLAKSVKGSEQNAEYVSTKKSRALAVSTNGLLDHTIVTTTKDLEQQTIHVTGVPGPAFYKVRDLIYENSVSL
jgi:Cft2 family RNA processing exonuclease